MGDENISLGGTPVALPAEGDKEYIVAVSQKASTAYVKQVASTKVDVSTYNAKMAEIDAALGEGDGNLGGRVSALEAYDQTVPGLISSAVEAEETRATGVEGGLRTDVDANTAAIAVLNGSATVSGSVAKALADANAYTDAREAVLQGNINGKVDVVSGSSLVADTEIAKLAALPTAAELSSSFDGKVDKNGTDRLMTAAEGEKLGALPTNAELTSTFAGKVDVVSGYSLVADTEISKLAGYPAYSAVTSAIDLKANAADVYTTSQTYTKTEVNAAIDAAASKVFRYKGAATIKPESNPIVLVKDGEDVVGVVGDVYQVGSEEYVFTDANAWERLGTAVDLSPYSTTSQMEAAISSAVGAEETRAMGIESGLNTRLTTAEGGITSMQNALGGLTTSGSVESAISSAEAAAIASAGSAADNKISAAIGSMTVNGQSFANNAAAVVYGGHITLGSGYVAGASDVVALTSASTVDSAFGAIVTELNTLDGAVSANSSSIASVSSSVSAIEAALPISAFNSSNTVEAALTAIDGAKVDKVAGSSLVSDTEITKLAAYPAYTSVSSAIDSKVTAVSGYSLVADAEITKLAGLNDQATTTAALNDKVDKVSGSSLIADTKVAKLDALPTNAQLTELLGAKVDKQPVVSAATQSLEAGKRYVVTADFAGTLPADAANGSIVEIFVLVGGADRLVSAPTGETILGQNLPCAIGITEEGWTLNNESYTFIKNGTDWHVL